jgi:4-aminobutyrate aminotransferase
MGSLSLTNSKIKQRAGFGPLLPMVYHAPFPRVRAWHEGTGGDGTAELDHLRRTILGRLVSPEDVAAIVVEPIQGEGGYFPAPPAFIHGLREICDEHGIVLIADEIQSGMGRTGDMWAMEGYSVEPDVVTVAKGIASGMPLGAFIGKEKLFTWTAGTHGSTFAGNPVCCAAALATLDLLEGGLMENAARMGERLRAGVEYASEECGVVRDIRGKGLMLGVEFGSHEEANAVQFAAFERGLLVLECGEASIRFCPPLIVDEAAVDTAIRLYAESLASVGCPIRPLPGMAETGG